jgi:hypothetical protein
MFIPVGIVSASVQTFESDIGNVEITLPYTAEPGEFSSGSSLQLVKPGTTKPIISINIWDAAEYNAVYKDFQGFAESFLSAGQTFDKMTTNDGKPMLFNFYQEGTDRDGNPNYSFHGYIDDSKGSGKYIVLHAPNNVIYQGEIIATYTKDQFAGICQSLTIK